MSAGYDFSTRIEITESTVGDYKEKWSNWWKAVQPVGQQQVAGTESPLMCDGPTLSDLRCGGEDGLITLLLGLFHWGWSGKDVVGWTEAFEDFRVPVHALSLV